VYASVRNTSSPLSNGKKEPSGSMFYVKGWESSLRITKRFCGPFPWPSVEQLLELIPRLICSVPGLDQSVARADIAGRIGGPDHE
jgi:hypothetical protein